MEKIARIIDQFDTQGAVTQIAPVGNGWINDTYRITTEGSAPDYILQRINHHVFQDVELLQHNIDRITSHIRKKLTDSGCSNIDRRVLRVLPTKTGELFYFDGENYWRMMLFISGSVTHETISAPLAYLTGKAFGEFQWMLSDIGENALGETIPDFHNMESRLVTFRETIAKNPENRLEKAQWMVDELLARAEKMCTAQRLYREGKLPKRVTHCDTKVNNILFDEEDRPLCVIDLDTTMPGFVLSDFGDFIRTSANTGAEDDPDLNRIDVDMDIFRAFAKGYIESARTFLLPIEIENLPYGAKLLTYMQTVRFLTDYIDGDCYYKIQYPEHNWQRTQAQFKLLQSIEEHEKEMQSYIQSLI